MKIRILYRVHSSQHPGKFDLLAHTKSREIQALAPSIQLYGNVLREAEADDPPSPVLSHPWDSTPETQPITQPSPVLHHEQFEDLFSTEEPDTLMEFNQYFPILSNVDQTYSM